MLKCYNKKLVINKMKKFFFSLKRKQIIYFFLRLFVMVTSRILVLYLDEAQNLKYYLIKVSLKDNNNLTLYFFRSLYYSILQIFLFVNIRLYKTFV